MQADLNGNHFALQGAHGEPLKGHEGGSAKAEGRFGLLDDQQVFNADPKGAVLIVARLVADNHPRLQRLCDVVPAIPASTGHHNRIHSR